MDNTSDMPNFKDSLKGIMTIRGQGKFIFLRNLKPSEKNPERGTYVNIRHSMNVPRKAFKIYD